MKSRIALVGLASLAVLAAGCTASKPELTPDEQKDMDKLFREGIKPNNGASPSGGTTPAAGTTGSKPMNQDAG